MLVVRKCNECGYISYDAEGDFQCPKCFSNDFYETIFQEIKPNLKLSFEELKNAAQPLVDILYKYYNPHTTIIIEMDHVEILCGDMAVPFEIKD